MQGKQYKQTQRQLLNYGQHVVERAKKKWATGGDDYPGKSNGNIVISADDKIIQLKMLFSGQRMWTMEFGKGHADSADEVGVKLSFTKTKIFQEYTKSQYFNAIGRLADARERYKPKAKRKGKSQVQRTYKLDKLGYKEKTGGAAYNKIRIFTRSGYYKDLDGVPHKGSGIGGKYGLNTEAFTFHGKMKTLARDGQGIIASILNIVAFDTNHPRWRVKDSEVIEVIGNSVAQDIADYLSEVLSR